MDFLKDHEFLATYLRYVENTESPRIFHVWVALSALSACMGRRCWFEQGTGQVYPNMYIVLTGPPGTRKGYAMKYSKTLLMETTGVKFAPDDTGGHRQGLIAAMTDFGNEITDEDLAAILATEIHDHTDTISSLSNGAKSSVVDQLGAVQIDTRDPRTMYVAASELNSFLGENNTQMLTFLQEMWDGAPYKYRLKTTQYEIKDAVLGIIGATTPTQISLALPPEAVGQGFTSRVIFVFADKQYARIPRSSLDQAAGERIRGLYSLVFNKFGGPFTETAAAAKKHDEIYMRGSVIRDPRFTHYCDRRQTHLQKTAMALTAGRGQMTIEAFDYEIADALLLATEAVMPDALGEYGMNKLSAAKQRMLEYIRNSDGPIPTAALFGIMSKDMTAIDFKAVVAELHNAKKISLIDVQNVGQCIIGISDSAAKKASKEYGELEFLMQPRKRAQ